MPEPCPLFLPYDHALSSRIEIVCVDPLGVDPDAVYGYRLLSQNEAALYPGVHGFIVKIHHAEVSVIGCINQDGTLSPLNAQPTARLMAVDENIQINACDLDPQDSFVTSSSYLEYVVGLAHKRTHEPNCYVIENSLYQINLETEDSERQTDSRAELADKSNNTGNSEHQEAHGQRFTGASKSKDVGLCIHQDRLSKRSLRDMLPSFIQADNLSYEICDEHPSLDLSDARRITTPEALGVLAYLLWGNPELSLAPLERSLITGMSTQRMGNTPFELEQLSESGYPLSIGFQSVISYVLAIQKISLSAPDTSQHAGSPHNTGSLQNAETSQSGSSPLQADTPQSVDLLQNADAHSRITSSQNSEPLHNDGDKTEVSALHIEGLIPFDVIFNADSQFFSIVPHERNHKLTSFLIGLETKLACATIANELLITFNNPQALTSELLYNLAENAAVRRIGRRSPWPFLPQELQACATDLQTEPQKIKARAYPQEFDARMMIGTLFRKTNFTVPLYRSFFSIDLSQSTERRGVCDFEFPSSSYLPKFTNDPSVLGACSPLSRKQHIEQFRDYVSGLTLAQGMLLFNAAPTLDTVVVNAYAPDPFIHIPEAQIERNTSPLPSSCMITAKIDHAALDKDALYLIGDTAEVLEMETGGFIAQTAGFDPQLYIQDDLFSDPPSYEPVKPYLTCLELNECNLAQDSSLLNELSRSTSAYEPTIEERSILGNLRALLEELDVLASHNPYGHHDEHICTSLKAHEPTVQRMLAGLSGKTLYAFDSVASQIIFNEHFGLAESSVLIDPILAEFYLALGTAYANLEQYPEAIQAYRSGLAISPGEAVFYTELAWISYCLRDFTTMRQYLDVALKLAYREEDIARYYCCEAAYAYEFEEYQKAGVYTLLCMKWNSHLFAEFLSQLIIDISNATGRPQAGVTPLNLEILMNHYGIFPLPHEQSFIALEKLAREFINTRNFPEGAEILEALYPFVQQEGVADVLFTIPEPPLHEPGNAVH